MLEILTLLYALEFGYTPNEVWELGDSQVSINDGFYTNLEAEVQVFETLYIGGGILTRMLFTEPYFAPFLDEYSFRAGLILGPVRIGYEHKCIHPVISELDMPVPNAGGFSRVFIRMSNH